VGDGLSSVVDGGAGCTVPVLRGLLLIPQLLRAHTSSGSAEEGVAKELIPESGDPAGGRSWDANTWGMALPGAEAPSV